MKRIGSSAARLPSALFAMVVVGLALWWIGRSLIDPVASTHSVAILLRRSDPTRAGDEAQAAQAPSEAAIARARALVEREPLAAEAYAVLAFAAAHAGQDERAVHLMRIAAAWWPRDILVQSWLLARSLRLGDRTAVAARFDTIARVRPDTLDAMTAAIAPVLVDPAATAAFADLLAARPPWRTRFIDIAARQWRAPAGLIALVDRLQVPPSTLDSAELRPVLNRLLTAGLVDQAYLAWLRSLPPARLTTLGHLYNGHFLTLVSNLPFDWEMPTVPGARAAISGPPTQRILTVGFLGGRVALAPIRHDLALAPGSYRLTGRVATDRLRTEPGVRWRIACFDDPDRVLAASDRFKDTTPWRDFAMDFTIPETSCGAQVLSLVVDAQTALEQEASGIASFAALDIEPR